MGSHDKIKELREKNGDHELKYSNQDWGKQVMLALGKGRRPEHDAMAKQAISMDQAEAVGLRLMQGHIELQA